MFASARGLIALPVVWAWMSRIPGIRKKVVVREVVA